MLMRCMYSVTAAVDAIYSKYFLSLACLEANCQYAG